MTETRCSFVHPNGWRCILEPRHAGACRKHVEPKIGDTFGNVRITSLFRGPARLDLRASVKCLTCGAAADVYVFNLRDRPPACVKGGRCR
jgi:hypothetical protein